MKDLTSLRAAGPEIVEALARWIDKDAFENRPRSSRNQHAANLSRTRARRLAKQVLRFRPIADALSRATEAESALTASQARAGELEGAIRWALGEGDSDFGDNIPLAYKGRAGAFWWRTELRRRAALTGGGGEGFRSAREPSVSGGDHDGIGRSGNHHAADCDWQHEQITAECTCGAKP